LTNSVSGGCCCITGLCLLTQNIQAQAIIVASRKARRRPSTIANIFVLLVELQVGALPVLLVIVMPDGQEHEAVPADDKLQVIGGKHVMVEHEVETALVC